MASTLIVSQGSIQFQLLRSMCCTMNSRTVKMNAIEFKPCISRRVGGTAVVTSVILTIEAILNNRMAKGVDFRMTVPDQTVEEAKSMITEHAQALLDVKALIELEDWREAQGELRRSSGYLKQDIYTIIQVKEGSMRPLLRRLYSDLFNNVTKLDYAARDKDITKVWKIYDNITAILGDILSRI